MELNDDMDGRNQPEVLRKRIDVSRPVYSEKEFQQVYQKTAKEHVSMKDQVKRKLSRCSCSKRDVRKMMQGFFPILRWLPQYDVKKDLVGDIMAGLTVGVMRLPQGKFLHFYLIFNFYLVACCFFVVFLLM